MTNPTAPQDGGEKLARRIAAAVATSTKTGRVHATAYQPAYEAALAAIDALDLTAVRNEVLEEAAKVCEQQRNDFLSPEYATGQPLSSIQERFACSECAAAIRALQQKGPSNG